MVKDLEAEHNEFLENIKVIPKRTLGNFNHDRCRRQFIIPEKGIKAKCTSSVLDSQKLIQDFDPTPSRKVQEKIDYFFMPYDMHSNVAISMKFNTQDVEDEANIRMIEKL